MSPSALTMLFAAALSANALTLTSKESVMAKAVDAEGPAALGLFERLVNINSGTMNLPGVIAVKDVIAPQLESLGFTVRGLRRHVQRQHRMGTSLQRADHRHREAMEWR